MLVEVFSCGVTGVGYAEFARMDAGTVAVFACGVIIIWPILPGKDTLFSLFARAVKESVDDDGIFLLPFTVSSSDSFTFTACFLSPRKVSFG